MSSSCQVSEGWNFVPESEHENPLLLAAPFTFAEHAATTAIIIMACIGLMANLLELYILYLNRIKWNRYYKDGQQCYFPGAYLTCLALTDAVYLGLVLHYFIRPWFASPVSYNAGFDTCGHHTGAMLVASVISSGFITVIAIETLFLDEKWLPSKLLTIIAICILALVFVAIAVPTNVYTDDMSRCVHWPNTGVLAGAYENFPDKIITCPWKHFITLRFALFHDVPAYFIPAALLIYGYRQVVGNGSSASLCYASHAVTTMMSMSNLKARIASFVLSGSLARIVNITGALYLILTGASLPEFTVGSELGVFILRGMLFLIPILNPFVYFFYVESYRPMMFFMTQTASPLDKKA